MGKPKEAAGRVMVEDDDEHISIDRIEVALKTAIAIGPNAPKWIFKFINDELCSRLARELAGEEHVLDLDPKHDGSAVSNHSNCNRQDKFLTTVQVARILHVTPETLRLLRHAGRGPPHSKRMVRHWTSVYSRKELDDWIELQADKNVRKAR